MAVYVGNNILTGVSGSDAFKINYNSVTDILRVDSTGRSLKPNQISFMAYISTAAAWITYPSGWAVMPFNATAQNIGNGYNTSTNRFTAPVAGAYIFQTSTYLNKNTGGAIGNNVQMGFYVNGSASLRRGGPNVERIRLHGYAAGYNSDTQMQESINLLAGDYVEVYVYADQASYCRYYNAYTIFTGALVA